MMPPVAWSREAAAASGERGTLAGFVDTLLPADDLSPSASSLGVHDDILSFSAQVPRLPDLLHGGASWLNATGGARFEALSEGDRNKVVAWMSRSDGSQAPYRFFEVVRLLAVEFYYAHAEAIAGFPLNEAPQPRGYPPPWT
jgi:hypothetical protein